jgi:NADH-quinone oxidoreductase subunit L
LIDYTDNTRFFITQNTVIFLLLTLTLLILFLPLANFLLWLILPAKAGKRLDIIALFNLIITFLASLLLLNQVWQKPPTEISWTWFVFAPDTRFQIGFWLDNLTGAMLVLVSFISLLVHLFSREYMHSDSRYHTYFAYLGLFTFAMLGVVLVNDLLLLYVFWELVGLSSYLLIGFWREKQSANQAAQKAFLMNRVGDVGFLIGILLVFVYFGSFQLSVIAEKLPTLTPSLIPFTWIGIGLFCGTIGKSAQFPLQNWLPDAMEGPTPVSALIHAATMVAAGVFLLARVFFLLNEVLLSIIAGIGAITLLWGACSALVQKDLKKILAYSTISQLGYMVMAMGIGAYSAGLLHLFTHAFFKAGLFLGAGAIIHTLHQAGEKTDLHFDAQNIYMMGGLRRKLPFTFVVFSICAFALMGLPFFSGFVSKDAILTEAWAWAGHATTPIAYLIPIAGFSGAFLTAWYVSRLLWLVFGGESQLTRLFTKGQQTFDTIHEVSWQMRLPLALLATFSLSFWFLLNPFSTEMSWLAQSFAPPKTFFNIHTIDSHAYHSYTAALSMMLIGLGIGMATYFYRRYQSQGFFLLFGSQRLYRLGLESFYWDKLLQSSTKFFLKGTKYLALFDRQIIDRFLHWLVMAIVVFAHIVAWIDRTFVDGFVKLIVNTAQTAGSLLRNPADGKLQGYFILTLLFLFGLLWWWMN